ncbi:MAG: tetratricopeptide repeat protein [Deltaproteobacteria bacterium]|nr:tetratricopeptide repeat protein [Deltaproteobacteria bacterium]
MRGAALLVLVLPAVALADAQVDLARALRMERAGDPEGAVRVLGEISRGAGGELTDDALMQAGRILEDKLGRPAEALERYRELASRFPTSRLARRAVGRIAFLEPNLATGEAPLVELQSILGRPAAREVLPGSIRRMERLLALNPDLAARDRALLWLAGAYKRVGQADKALGTYREVVRSAPRGRAGDRALEGIGETYLALGRVGEAERAFLDLRARGARAAAAQGLGKVDGARRRLFGVRAAWGLVVLVVLVLFGAGVAKAGRELLRPPIEVAFVAPLFALLLALALAEQCGPGARSWQFAAAARAIGLMAAGGICLAFLGGVVARARGVPRWLVALLPPSLALAAIAICLLALDATDLSTFVLETLRSGAAR